MSERSERAKHGTLRIGKTNAAVLAFHSEEIYSELREGRPSADMNQELLKQFVETVTKLFSAPIFVLEPKTRIIDLPATDPYELAISQRRSGKTELFPDYLCAAQLLGRKRTELYELTLIWAQDVPWGFEPLTTTRLADIPWESGLHVAP